MVMVMVLTMAVIYDGDRDSNDDDNDGYNDGGDDGYDDDGDPFSHWMPCALRCPIQCSRPHPHSLNIVAINVSSPFLGLIQPSSAACSPLACRR